MSGLGSVPLAGLLASGLCSQHRLHSGGCGQRASRDGLAGQLPVAGARGEVVEPRARLCAQPLPGASGAGRGRRHGRCRERLGLNAGPGPPAEHRGRPPAPHTERLTLRCSPASTNAQLCARLPRTPPCPALCATSASDDTVTHGPHPGGAAPEGCGHSAAPSPLTPPLPAALLWADQQTASLLDSLVAWGRGAVRTVAGRARAYTCFK